MVHTSTKASVAVSKIGYIDAHLDMLMHGEAAKVPVVLQNVSAE